MVSPVQLADIAVSRPCSVPCDVVEVRVSVSGGVNAARILAEHAADDG